MKTSLVVLILSLFHLCVADVGIGTTTVFGEALEAKLTENENKIEALRQEIQSIRVAFGASIGESGFVGPYLTERILIYKNVFTNTGAYSLATGIFTAPIKGVYYFSFTGHSHTFGTMGLELMKNGVKMVSVYTHAYQHRWETATNSITLQLKVGDQVYISLGAYTWIYDNDNHVSTFNGHLLFPL